MSSKKRLQKAVSRTKRMYKCIYAYSVPNGKGDMLHFVHTEK